MPLLRCAALILGLGLLGGGAAAQVPVVQTPREEFQLPEAETPGELEAPPILLPTPPSVDREQLSGSLQVEVRGFRFTGNTVFSDDELAEVVQPWAGRLISSAELQAAARALTLHYVERGYVNSGALIPDQRVDDGRVELEIVEGRLADVVVEDTGWFRPAYFEKRLMLEADRPLRAQNLERRLQRLQQDPRIRRINAQLGPGTARGEAVLRVRIEETLPFLLGLEWADDKPPSVGEQAGRIRAGLRNLSGWGDQLTGVVALTEGMTDAEGRYELPFTRWDTAFQARFRWTDSRVVEPPFDVQDFESLTTTVGAGFVQPLLRTRENETRIALLGEWRRNETKLEGSRFGVIPWNDGRYEISVLRAGGEWLNRTRHRVIAWRGIASIGLPVLGATETPGDNPDTNFVSFLSQFQWVQLLRRPVPLETVLRADLQVALDPLVPMEEIAVGGMRSVRGYRENQVVRDSAVIASLELRFPIFRSAGERHVVQLAPFVDVGHGWNVNRNSPRGFIAGEPDPPVNLPDKTLTSLGVGVRYRFLRWVLAEFYWGVPLSSVVEPFEKSLQDHGIHFRLRVDLL